MSGATSRRTPARSSAPTRLQAGGVFSGGLLAAFAAAAWYVWKHHMPALGTCDAFAPGLALGHAIGRVGCFAAGCCYGKETHHWWGVVFRNPLANSITGTPLNIPLEPTQLFESAVELANFFFLMWMLKRRKFDGQIFGAFLFIYGIARFFLEYLRDDPGRGSVFGGALTGTQLIAVGLVLAGGFIWWLRPGANGPDADSRSFCSLARQRSIRRESHASPAGAKPKYLGRSYATACSILRSECRKHFPFLSLSCLTTPANASIKFLWLTLE